MLPPSEFPRRMTDAANAGNEDHAHRRQLRHHLRVMSGTARQSTTREAESSCSSFNGFLQFDVRIRWLVGRAGGKRDRSHVGVDYDKIERTASIGVSDLLPIGSTGGQSERRAPKSVLLLSSAALWNAASRDFFGSERRTNTTRWTPGPAIPAVAPKQGPNRDDHSKQRGLNRPRHDECGLRMTMP